MERQRPWSAIRFGHQTPACDPPHYADECTTWTVDDAASNAPGASPGSRKYGSRCPHPSTDARRNQHSSGGASRRTARQFLLGPILSSAVHHVKAYPRSYDSTLHERRGKGTPQFCKDERHEFELGRRVSQECFDS
mmetsp:Transcript_16233/g.28545  ORF Transcript_16233/g.28545 Transcript_16233/m.28545 type:complete len:136 (+) Transcript_16233:357-764(+)